MVVQFGRRAQSTMYCTSTSSSILRTQSFTAVSAQTPLIIQVLSIDGSHESSFDRGACRDCAVLHPPPQIAHAVRVAPASRARRSGGAGLRRLRGSGSCPWALLPKAYHTVCRFTNPFLGHYVRVARSLLATHTRSKHISVRSVPPESITCLYSNPWGPRSPPRSPFLP